jgi:hypothetical protein
MPGVPTYRRKLSGDAYSNAAWTPIYLSLDVLGPRAVGRFGDNVGADNYTSSITWPDLAECGGSGNDYVLVAFPGLSWFGENGGPLNQVPSIGGSFHGRQA